MIRFRLREMIIDKEFKEGRRIALDEIARETGIHRTTLSRIAGQRGDGFRGANGCQVKALRWRAATGGVGLRRREGIVGEGGIGGGDLAGP